MIKIASFNVENLFMRPNAFNLETMEAGEVVLEAYREVNSLFNQTDYTPAMKQRMLELLLQLDIYRRNDQNAIRKVITTTPQWAWMRKNRGRFDREPRPSNQNVEIIAEGRADWIGWVELAKEPVNETATRMTARAIRDIDADIIGIVEAEDRPSLVRFNRELMDNHYGHVMLVDGNDERGIDVGLLTRSTANIELIRSHVDETDNVGLVFSRDCPDYTVRTPGGAVIHVLLNHFKSQSGGGDAKRARQARQVREYVDALVADNQHVVVMGDFNEGPNPAGEQTGNIARLFEAGGPLVSCYGINGFVVGERQGTFNDCGMGNRLDYILLSQSLADVCTGGGVFREGLWGDRKTRPTAWHTYTEMTHSAHGASDHAAVFVTLEI